MSCSLEFDRHFSSVGRALHADSEGCWFNFSKCHFSKSTKSQVHHQICVLNFSNVPILVTCFWLIVILDLALWSPTIIAIINQALVGLTNEVTLFQNLPAINQPQLAQNIQQLLHQNVQINQILTQMNQNPTQVNQTLVQVHQRLQNM